MTSTFLAHEARDPIPITGRTYGYVRASHLEEVESPEDQSGIITTYCHRIGRHLDGMFDDNSLSEGLPLSKREGGKRLLLTLRKGDHIVVARLDLLIRSYIEFGDLLARWAELGVTVHLCDLSVTLDPQEPSSRLLIDILVSFTESRRRRISTRSKDACYYLKADGRRYARYAPYGFKWEERGRISFMVPDPDEQRICLKAAEMKIEGYSFHQIRRYFAYTWKVRNRKGNEFGYEEVRKLVFSGAKLMHAAESQAV
jgi:DNA invertase Pin-like site-specific DNA recombinase